MADMSEASGGTNGVGAGLNEGAVAAKAGATSGSTVAAGGGMVMISVASGSFVLEA